MKTTSKIQNALLLLAALAAFALPASADCLYDTEPADFDVVVDGFPYDGDILTLGHAEADIPQRPDRSVPFSIRLAEPAHFQQIHCAAPLSISLRRKSFCKAPDSAAKQRDLHQFVGDATGIMPVGIGGCSRLPIKG